MILSPVPPDTPNCGVFTLELLLKLTLESEFIFPLTCKSPLMTPPALLSKLLDDHTAVLDPKRPALDAQFAVVCAFVIFAVFVPYT